MIIAREGKLKVKVIRNPLTTSISIEAETEADKEVIKEFAERYRTNPFPTIFTHPPLGIEISVQPREK